MFTRDRAGGCALIAVFVFSAASWSCAQASGKKVGESQPASGPSSVLNAFVEAVNSQDASQINQFVRRSFALDKLQKDSWALGGAGKLTPDRISLSLLNLAHRSGGLAIDSTSPADAGVNAVVHTRSTGRTIYLSFHTTSSSPPQIDGYQIIPAPPPVEEFIPKLPAAASMTERLRIAKQAFAKACAQDIFSGALLIARHGEVAFSGACGDADKNRRIPNRIETRFGIASVGKVFTAVAVAQLVAQGKLSYDEPIIRYLPDYPNQPVASKITLRQLLTHTSGLGDFFSKAAPHPSSHRPALHRLTDYYPLFANDPLLFEPGKGNSYSNTGFLVASLIVERVSGEEFRQYLRKHIFEPAGMANTGWDAPPGAKPYAQDPTDLLAPKPHWVSATGFYKALPSGPAAGPGGEYSTVGDLLKFSTALQTGKLLVVKDFNLLIQENYGCQCSSDPGHRIYAHPGGGPGVDAGLKLYVDQDFVIVVLSNYDPPFSRILAGWLGDLLLDP